MAFWKVQQLSLEEELTGFFPPKPSVVILYSLCLTAKKSYDHG
jgi:hypothetical protein